MMPLRCPTDPVRLLFVEYAMINGPFRNFCEIINFGKYCYSRQFMKFGVYVARGSLSIKLKGAGVGREPRF